MAVFMMRLLGVGAEKTDTFLNKVSKSYLTMNDQTHPLSSRLRYPNLLFARPYTKERIWRRTRAT